MTTPRQRVNNKISEIRVGVKDEIKEVYHLEKEFATLVFSDDALRLRIPREMYKRWKKARSRNEVVPADVIEGIAIAVKEWASQNGATHFTLTFQPLTGFVAEKHDSFLEIADGAIADFSGNLLSLGEADASSFPNGGLRATNMARGYTVWDVSSPVYLKPSLNGNTLVIPSAFFSWKGECLDVKAPLLRSSDRLSHSVVKVLAAAGVSGVEHAYSTLGAEQEYFLIDRDYYLQRPDLQACGRTLFGARSAKHQQLEDHYYGNIPPRIVNYMQDTERQLWRLGVPVKTRHCEVAPGQFETAPIFEASTLASDHNLLEMEIMRDTARKHGLEYLVHEKPFAGINGSGKHNNYSIATNNGLNLFDPGNNPFENVPFLLSLAAVLRGVNIHGDVLRSAIAVPGNDHRLGGNEAPPAIVSVYLGEILQDIVTRILDNGEIDSAESSPDSMRAKYGRADKKKGPYSADFNTNLQTGTNLCPAVERAASDRNRTSPFPFVGNKFEFRAVGASQNCAVPVTALNCIMAESYEYLTAEIESLVKTGTSRDAAFRQVVKKTIRDNIRVVFNGDGYSAEWVAEANRRGLYNLPTAVDALELLDSAKNQKLFADVLNPAELTARKNVSLEIYVKTLDIEGRTASNMARTLIVPAALRHQAQVAQSLVNLQNALGKSDSLTVMEGELKKLSGEIASVLRAADDLDKIIAGQKHSAEVLDDAKYSKDKIRPALAKLREHVDALELIVDDALWPLPKYSEMLFNY